MSVSLNPGLTQVYRTQYSTPYVRTERNKVWVNGRECPIRLELDSPKILVIDGFLTSSECERLINIGDHRMQPSTTIDNNTGAPTSVSGRSSSNAVIQRCEDEFVSTIDARLAELAQWPIDYAEGLQVVKYEVGQEYTPHMDWFNPDFPGMLVHMSNGGQRLATSILYLCDVEVGGGTSFPTLGLKVNPSKGSVLFFKNTDDYLDGDVRTLHAGLPVVEGVKYIANKWYRERRCA